MLFATYIAAAQEFAILGSSDLAELALAIGSVESAHRVHARLYAIDAGVITGVPNNIGFQQAKFDRVGKAVSALRALGFLDGGGQSDHLSRSRRDRQHRHQPPQPMTTPATKGANPMTDLETFAGKPMTRRTLLTSTGAGAAALLLSSTGLMRPEAARTAGELHYGAAPEQVQDVLDIFATNEAFGVTLVGTIPDAAKNGSYTPPLPDKVLRSLRAVRAEEQFHLDAQKRTGARLRTDTFFLVDPHVLEDPHSLFLDLVELEDAAIGSVMASFRTFTHARRPDLIKQNFQFAAEEAEHRLLANRNLGIR
ncbi:MAG: hypothetical protein ACR2LV_12150, partial [Solirubrobacteraceae bacterium]